MDKEEIKNEIINILSTVSDINIAANMLFALMESNWSTFDDNPVYEDGYVD